jgi:ankyrin repeat protein
MVAVLLDAGADPNAKAQVGHQGARSESKVQVGWTALHVAAAMGADAVIPTLVSRGADLNARDAAGKTPLHLARHATTVATLARLGCDMDPVDKRGETPLVGALSADLAEFLGFSLAGGTWAHEIEQVVMTLIGAGARADVTTADGRSLLQLCISVSGDVGWRVQALVKADPNERDATGATLLQLAARKGLATRKTPALRGGVTECAGCSWTNSTARAFP